MKWNYEYNRKMTSMKACFENNTAEVVTYKEIRPTETCRICFPVMDWLASTGATRYYLFIYSFFARQFAAEIPANRNLTDRTGEGASYRGEVLRILGGIVTSNSFCYLKTV